MTLNNLVVFIISLFNFLTKTLKVDYTDNVSQELTVCHYDCTKMQDNRTYSLNKVAECKISPENLYVAPATLILYQKSYRTHLSATKCSHSVTYGMLVTPEKC